VWSRSVGALRKLIRLRQDRPLHAVSDVGSAGAAIHWGDPPSRVSDHLHTGSTASIMGVGQHGLVLYDQHAHGHDLVRTPRSFSETAYGPDRNAGRIRLLRAPSRKLSSRTITASSEKRSASRWVNWATGASVSGERNAT
jgi:hypothetical protein